MPLAANGGVFVWDTKAAKMLLASISYDGTTSTQGNAPIVSADGRFVAFTSSSSNLVTGDTNGRVDAYIHDMLTGQTLPLSITPQNVPLNAGSVGPISADGRYAVYDNYLEDRILGVSTLLNVDSTGLVGNGSAGVASTSSDGTEVVFSSSSSNLVSGDTNAVTDVFLYSNPFLSTPRVASLTLGQTVAAGGSLITGTVQLTAPAPAQGATVAISSNNPAAQVPATVFVPAGVSSIPISFATSAVQSETVLTLVASYDGGSPIALLTLEPAGQIAIDPPSWDFGNEAVGTASGPQLFTIANSGSAALSINSIQLYTGQAFSIGAKTCGSSIAPGGNCTVSITFKPTASGSISDALQVSYGSQAMVQTVGLAGTGATPLAALSPVALSFTSPGSPSATATLTNSGTASLANISASISGTNGADFAISSDGCSGTVLPAISSCLITVAFSPKAAGTRVGTLSVANSASGSPQIIGLSGIEIQATPAVLWTPSPTSLTYGATLGTGVLDATATVNGNNVAGVFAYTATANGGTSQSVTPNTILGAGTYVLTATFAPTDITDYTSATGTVTLTVNKATPTITWATPAAVTVGTALGSTQLNAIASSAGTSVAGTLSYSPNTGTVMSTAGQTILSVTFIPSDPADYNTASGSVTLTVNPVTKTTPTVTVTNSPTITTAQPLTVTVTVGGTPTPTGSVTLVSGTFSGSGSLVNGVATITMPIGSLAVGTDQLTATYQGDNNYNTQTGTGSVFVTAPAKTTPTVTVTNPPTITTAQSLTVTVTVAGTPTPTPTGSVTLVGGTFSGSGSLVNGVATIIMPIGSLAVGTDQLTATYQGDSNYNTQTGNGSVVVTAPAKTTPTVTVTNPPTITTAQSLAVTVTVTGTPTPTGSVTVVGGTFSGSGSLGNGVATITMPVGSLAVGTDPLTATYQGDSNYNTQTGTGSVVVTVPVKASQTIIFAPPTSPVVYGVSPITLSATATSGLPVSLSISSGPGTININTLTITSAGTVVVAANQAGDTNYAAAPQVTQSVVVNQASPTISFTVANHTFGNTPFTALATSNSSGAITYSVVSGPATVTGSTVTLTGTGTVVLQATQAATANYTGGTQNATFIVTSNSQTITFVAPISPVNYGVGPVTLSASASSGLAVAFSILSGPASVSGTTLTITGAGTVVVAADQSGNTNYTAAPEVARSITVNKIAPTVGLTATPNPVLAQNNFTLIAAVTSSISTPTGSVVFSENGASLGTGTLSGGVATLTLATLPGGTHVITAVYSGDNNFNATTSAAVSEVVQDFTLNPGVSLPPVTVQPGGTATYTLPISPVGGNTIPVSVTFSALGSPAGATTTFTPAFISAGSGATNVVLTVKVPQVAMAEMRTEPRRNVPLVALTLLLLPFVGRIKRAHKRLGLLASLLLLASMGAAIAGLTGCGSGQPPQTYTITVTAASATLSHSTNLTLTVQ
jgi:hypothetical protein